MFNYDDDTKQEISVAAYLFAEKRIPFNDLCWMLAERQLYLQNNFQRVDENFISQRAAEIYYTSPSYDILCWLISEIDLTLKRANYGGHPKPHFIL
jgi:hypothetical protein